MSNIYAIFKKFAMYVIIKMYAAKYIKICSKNVKIVKKSNFAILKK